MPGDVSSVQFSCAALSRRKSAMKKFLFLAAILTLALALPALAAQPPVPDKPL